MKKQKRKPTDSLEMRTAFTLETGANFADRTIYLWGGIDHETAYKFFVPFQAMDKSGQWIRVILNSPGGDEASGFAIYELIKHSNSPVLIDGYGTVFSMASMIMQAGTVRRMSPECRFMVHCGSVGLTSDVETNTFVALAGELGYINKRYSDIMGLKSKKPKEEVTKLCNKESYMSAEEAVKWGFIDTVIQTGSDIEVSIKKVKPKKAK